MKCYMSNDNENKLSFYRVLKKRVTYKTSPEVCDYVLSETGFFFWIPLDSFVLIMYKQ